MQSELIQHLMNEVIPEANRTQDPEASLLKTASANNLPPAALERLAQLWNAGRTLNHFEKGANRGDSIPLVDIPKLVEAYGDFKPEAKKASNDIVSVSRFPTAEKLVPIVKAASAKVPTESELREKVAREQLTVQNNIRKLQEYVVDQELEKNAAAIAWVTHHSTTLGEEGLFQKNASDMLCLYGDKAVEPLEWLGDVLSRHVKQSRQNFKVTDVEDGKRIVKIASGALRLIRPSTLTESFESLMDISENIKVAKEEIAKLASGKKKDDVLSMSHQDIMADGVALNGVLDVFTGEDPVKSYYSKGKTKEPEKMDFKELGGLKDDLNKSLGALLHLNVRGNKNLTETLEGVLGKPPVNRDQMYIDDAGADIRKRTALQEVLMTDEALSEVDPATIEMHYNTLMRAAPEALEDPLLLSNLLRYSIERAGPDMTSMKAFAESENLLRDSAKNRSRLAKEDNTPSSGTNKKPEQPNRSV